MKIALVHDWLITYSGAERVLEQILKLYPEADLFSLLDFIPPGQRDFILNKPVKTSFLQKFPFARKRYRAFLPFMPLAIEQFDMSPYDLVISSNHAVAKGIITGPNQLHVCVCYSPIRYAWDLTHHYLKEAGLDKGLRGWLAKYILHKIRMWDYRTANGVDEFIAISDFIAGRITKAYRRQSTVIYPPVDTDGFELCTPKEDFYLFASRMVPYKNTRLVVEAFSKMPDKKLVVIGDGPEMDRVKKIAGPNVELKGYLPFAELKQYMQRARALIFAAEEDFGIVPVEAQACGTPVIAYGRGGVLETVVDGKTGLFFDQLTVSEIVETIRQFERVSQNFRPEEIRAKALQFSTDRFRKEFKLFIDNKIESYFDNKLERNSAPRRFIKIAGKKEVKDSAQIENRKIEMILKDAGKKASIE